MSTTTAPTKARKAAKPSKAPSPKPKENLCACGCGTPVWWTYAKGHDAKHAAKLFDELKVTWAQVQEDHTAGKYPEGTVKHKEALGRDQRREARVMVPAIEKAAEQLSEKRRGVFLEQVILSPFGKYFGAS